MTGRHPRTRAARAAPKRRRRRDQRRGVALILVLGALTVLSVMLAEFQDETSAELGSALSERDAVKAEYAARSGLNLSRLLIAAEPTIRKAPMLQGLLMMLFRGAVPQIPVWEFANQALGAFNDKDGTKAFAQLASVNIEDGKNLGLSGAGFEVSIVDEDSKINVNLAARGEAFSQIRLSGQLLGMMLGPQYDKMFEARDNNEQFSDRQTICSAIIDWADPDQDTYVCDPNAGATAQQTAAEDSFYEMLKKPYSRKNAAYDSLEELRLVRGVGDDFWSTFVEPDPENPKKRVLTVWGQGQINVNTADPKTIVAFLCSPNVAPMSPLCTDPEQMLKFLMFADLIRTMTAGAPIFGSPKAFINLLKLKPPYGPMLEAIGVKPVTFLSDDMALKALTAESKVFSIYATGYVRAGKRETKVRIHAVVDFRGAPPPGMPAIPPGMMAGLGMGTGGTAATSTAMPTIGTAMPTTGTMPTTAGIGTSTGMGGAAGNANLPPGATSDAIAGAFQPSPAGNVVYYRVE